MKRMSELMGYFKAERKYQTLNKFLCNLIYSKREFLLKFLLLKNIEHFVDTAYTKFRVKYTLKMCPLLKTGNNSFLS